MSKQICTLGMFIIDQFEFRDAEGNLTGRTQPDAIGGGGTYCAIGARIWLEAKEVGMVIDRGTDFPSHIQEQLDSYGPAMFLFRDRKDGMPTLRAINAYRGESRQFAYLTPRIRPMPVDFEGTPLSKPRYIHLVSFPERAGVVMNQIESIEGWDPVMIYEPMEGSCTPEELPKLRAVLNKIDILSPNAEEALGFLGMALPVSKAKVEEAAAIFLREVKQAVIIRSGALGAYTVRRDGGMTGKWVDAFWTPEDVSKVVDVTGAGNSFLGGLAAGLVKTKGDIDAAVFYASVSASFTIEQSGLPLITKRGEVAEDEEWNGDFPHKRLTGLRNRMLEM